MSTSAPVFEGPPAAAPLPGVFLDARWQWLTMLSWECDPALLRLRVPRGTELDDWNGRVMFSVVGFLFLRTRVLGIPIPLHRDFEELNLRFYVRRRGPEGWRRGVVFVKELVPRRAIAAVARLVYNESYAALPMRHAVELDPAAGTLRPGGAVEYGWRSGDRWNTLRAVTEGASRPLVEGSEEEFVTDHYWGYAAQRDGGCVEYRVEHPRWNVWRAAACTLDCDAAALYGSGFAEAMAAPPRSAFVADGSAVVVRRGVRI